MTTGAEVYRRGFSLSPFAVVAWVLTLTNMVLVWRMIITLVISVLVVPFLVQFVGPQPFRFDKDINRIRLFHQAENKCGAHGPLCSR